MKLIRTVGFWDDHYCKYCDKVITDDQNKAGHYFCSNNDHDHERSFKYHKECVQMRGNQTLYFYIYDI